MLLGTAGYDHFIGPRGDDRMVALLASGALTAVMALVLLEQSRFRVDPILRVIDWDRRWGFRRRSGILPFGDVQHVGVEVPIGDSGVPNRRIVLHIADGTLLPLTAGYQPDSDNAISGAAETLRNALGQPPPSAEVAARAFLAHGKTIDAIKVLREREGLDLTEAKRRVDELAGRDRMKA